MAPRKRTHKPDQALQQLLAEKPAYQSQELCWLRGGGARGNLHLEGRTLAERRLHPDPAAVHLDDLLGDGEAEARAALGVGKRAVDLVKLIEDPTLLVERYAGPGVRHRDREMAIPRARGDADFASVRELDRVANEIE